MERKRPSAFTLKAADNLGRFRESAQEYLGLRNTSSRLSHSGILTKIPAIGYGCRRLKRAD